MIGASTWTAAQIERGHGRLRRVLKGVGDLGRQRLFRMLGTLCLHRAATDAEVEALPEYARGLKACNLAGGGVETLWAVGLPGDFRPSTRPCERLTYSPCPRTGVLLPEDCGRCEPCLDRARLEQELDGERAAPC